MDSHAFPGQWLATQFGRSTRGQSPHSETRLSPIFTHLIMPKDRCPVALWPTLYAALTVSFVRLVTADHLRRRKEEMRLGQAAASQQMLQTYDITSSHDRAKLLRTSRMRESPSATILNVFMNQETFWGFAL